MGDSGQAPLSQTQGTATTPGHGHWSSIGSTHKGDKHWLGPHLNTFDEQK